MNTLMKTKNKCTHAFTAYTHHIDKKYVYIWCDACNTQLGKIKIKKVETSK